MVVHLSRYEICNNENRGDKALEERYMSALESSTRKRSHCLILSRQKRTITDLLIYQR